MSYYLKKSSQVVDTLERVVLHIKEDVNLQFKLLGFGISYGQWVVLNAINNNKGITQIELSKATEKEPASICRTLKFFTKRELTCKFDDPQNKKIKRVVLTPKGQALVKNAQKSVDEVSQKCLESIFDRELNVFVNVLDQILAKGGQA